MPARFIILGATGDLTARYLIPALTELRQQELLPSGSILGVGQDDWDTGRFRQHLADRLGEYRPDIPQAVRESVISALEYRKADVTDADQLRATIGATGEPVAVYLALQPALMGINGFVYASDVESIKAENSAHSFRLLHMDGKWHVFSSFFGGRIGTRVRFPGPNGESWCCANVIAPLRSKDWTITTSSVLQPLRVRVEWQDPSKIMPSVEMLNVQSEMRVIAVSGNEGQ